MWVGVRLWQYEQLEPYREGVSALKDGNFDLALTRLKPMAQAGNTEAQRDLAWMYAAGWGVVRDDIRAGIWLRRAECKCASPGEEEYNIGLEFLQTGKKDTEAGAKWIQRAAEAGYPKAQILLADRKLLAEKGLTIDPAISNYWNQLIETNKASFDGENTKR